MSDRWMAAGSITMFRLRSERLFQIWAHGWLTRVRRENVTREYVQMLAETVQHAYWDAARRNPSVREWVRDFLWYHDAKYLAITAAGRTAYVRGLIASELRSRPVHVEPAFDPSKPWWLRFQIAGRNEQKAIQTFSEQVGRAFLEFGPACPVVMSPEADWTDGLNIDDFLSSVAKSLKTKHFWQFWK